MAINETIVTGRKFRKCIDEATKLWQRFSFWSRAEDTEFDDGKNAEIKLGAIDGITDSLASTSSRIAASAKSVNQLSNDLAQQPDWITDSTGKITGYKTPGGADTVFPFSSAELLWTNPSIKSEETIVAPCNWEKYDKIIILACQYYGYPDAKFIQCCDIGATIKGWNLSVKDFVVYRTIQFTSGDMPGIGAITMYAETEHNSCSYNIPLKIWGINMEENFYAYP